MPTFGKYALIFGIAPISACAAPTDCSVEPARCLPPAYQVTTPANWAPQRARPTAIVPLVPLVPGVPTAAAPGARAVPMADGPLAQAQAAKLPVNGEMPAVDQRLIVVRLALSAALPALRARDLQALRPFVTAHYAQQFAEIEAQYTERFWRHADRVAHVLSSAHPEFTIEAQPDGHLQATVKSAEGLEIRPVVVQEGGVWKLDRL